MRMHELISLEGQKNAHYESDNNMMQLRHSSTLPALMPRGFEAQNQKSKLPVAASDSQ